MNSAATRLPRARGLTLVEVLVAMAVLGIVTASLVALQVGSLRAARTARDTRELAAAAHHQLGLARLLPETASCHDVASWPSVVVCQVTAVCIDESCSLRTVRVHAETVGGRSIDVHTVANFELESAPTALSASLESEP